ncbi:MAG: redox-sensitive transcriptional activator SoxR [Actinomycetota bacterium]
MVADRQSADLLTIGTVADRTGLAVSAVRFYEREGLITAVRSPSGHRKFTRATLRRVSFILACQRLGYTLGEIGAQLAALPDGRTPTDKDWARLAAGFRVDLDERIRRMEDLRDRLEGCIGCGCLSLERCAIYNPSDGAAGLGSGPRYLLGDSADDLPADGSPAGA